MTPCAHLHLRCFQMWLLSIYSPSRDCLEARLIVPQCWPPSPGRPTPPRSWSVPPSPFYPTCHHHQRCLLCELGAHLDHHAAQGVWMPQEVRIPINMLELRAVLLICQAFLPLLRLCHIQFLSDNIAAVVYIKKQGGTKSLSLCSESIHLWNWCIKHHITLQATYLSGTQNSLADTLSRTLYLNDDWELHDGVFQYLFHQWGILCWDLFATHKNCKLPLYYSREALGKYLQGDTLLLPWSDDLSYAFPPIPLLLQVLHKVHQD